MKDFHTQQRRAWLREIQHITPEDVERSPVEIVGEVIGGIALLGIVVAFIFVFSMLGFQ
jgi:hypothetical protein